MRHRSRQLLVAALLTGLCAFASRPALAVDAVTVPLETGLSDLQTLLTQLKERKKPNVEDINGSLDALAKAFFHIAPPELPAPTPVADTATDEEKKAAAAQQKVFEEAQRKHLEAVLKFQTDALDGFLKALTSVVVSPKQKTDNARNEVNLKAATVLGDILSSPDLAKNRDAKQLDKLRGDMSKELQAVIEQHQAKEAQAERLPSAAVTEATFAALARTNEQKVLQWLHDNFTHTNNAPFEVERLVAAHKAMKLFTNVPGKMRHMVAGTLIRVYSGIEGSAKQVNSSDPKTRTQAQAAKAFWDKVKPGVIEAVNYFATAHGGGAPTNAEGQGFTTMDEYMNWWRDHDKVNREPWLDPKKDEKRDAAPKEAPKEPAKDGSKDAPKEPK